NIKPTNNIKLSRIIWSNGNKSIELNKSTSDSGVDDARAHMSRTDFIDYDPTEDYTLTGAAYISYFYGDSFIKTNKYGHDGPYLIEKVDAADSIVVSMAKADQASVELLTGAVDEASSDEVENTTPDDLVGRGKPDTDNIKGTIL